MRNFFSQRCHCWRRRCFRAACTFSVRDLRSELRFGGCIYNLCRGARQQEYSEWTKRKSERVATSVEQCSILVSTLLFSLRTERVSERRKRQADRRGEADIVKLASVLPRSLSVNFIL